MGDLADDDRAHGMGIVAEYAGHAGKAQWVKPPAFHWNAVWKDGDSARGG